MLQTISIKVIGKVQGVFFRQSTKEKAVHLRINGTVKNCRDGTVIIIATGTAEQLAALAAWCKTGPPRASVSEIIITEQPFAYFVDFSIQR